MQSGRSLDCWQTTGGRVDSIAVEHRHIAAFPILADPVDRRESGAHTSVYSTRHWHQLIPGLCSIDAKPESSIPALPHMRIPNFVPTITSRCASQRNHEDLKHWLKLCGEATP